jgi:hypothetical protein
MQVCSGHYRDKVLPFCVNQDDADSGMDRVIYRDPIRLDSQPPVHLQSVLPVAVTPQSADETHRRAENGSRHSLIRALSSTAFDEFIRNNRLSRGWKTFSLEKQSHIVAADYGYIL